MEQEWGEKSPKKSFKSLTANLLSTKNNWAHRGTGLDQPQIPTTPPLHTETNQNTGCRGAQAERRRREEAAALHHFY